MFRTWIRILHDIKIMKKRIHNKILRLINPSTKGDELSGESMKIVVPAPMINPNNKVNIMTKINEFANELALQKQNLTKLASRSGLGNFFGFFLFFPTGKIFFGFLPIALRKIGKKPNLFFDFVRVFFSN